MTALSLPQLDTSEVRSIPSPAPPCLRSCERDHLMRSMCHLLVTAGSLVLWGCGSPAGSSSAPPAPPAEFAPICEQQRATCNADVMAPNLVGSYSGQGQTLVTSNELWRVGDANTFKVQITSQHDGQ